MVEEEEAAEGAQRRQEVGEEELDALDDSLRGVLEYVQCTAWALRSIYASESPWITTYSRLKEALQKDACVFKQGLLPLTMTVITGLATFLNDEYLDIELNVWRRRLDKVLEGAVEQGKLFYCLAEYYRYLAAEVRERSGAAREILDTVLFEARQFDKSRKLVHLTSNVRDHVWVPLLFVPYVGCFATPFAVKDQDSSMSKRIAAKTEGEMAVTAAWVLTDVLLPALEKVTASLEGVAEFFTQLLPLIEGLSCCEKPDDDPAWQERTESHVAVMKERIYRLRLKCLDLVTLTSTIEFTLEPIPNLGNEVVDDYVKDWLSAKRAPAELQLVVNIVSARGLPNADTELALLMSSEGSDPYCVCMIPAKKRSTVKTRVIRDNLNPIWNFETKIPDYSAGDDLEFWVYDKDYGKPDDLLGTVLLPGSEFYPTGFEGELKLKEAIGNTNKAYLRLKIKIQDAKTADPDEAGGVLLADKMRDATENTDVIWALEP